MIETETMRKKYLYGLLAIIAAIGSIVATFFLQNMHFPILDPKGPIAKQQFDLLIIATLLTSIVVIPVFGLTFYIVWKYRANNKKAAYNPEWDSSRTAETIWWLIPCVIIFILSLLIWRSSHILDPYRPLAADKKPLVVQVIALDWKWLFIYPEQDIATVNYLQLPVDTPINFSITSDAPMNSFWIPQLGGQVYAMAGMETKLHLAASEPGEYKGSSANISGKGFAGMRFTAKATSQKDFDAWVVSTKASSTMLDPATYQALAQPSSNNPATHYSSASKGLYDTVIRKYMTPKRHTDQSLQPSEQAHPTTNHDMEH